MARMLSYSARLISRVEVIDGHWILLKKNNERVLADGTKFVVRLGDYNIPIFLHGRCAKLPNGGWSLSRSNEEEHRQRLEDGLFWSHGKSIVDALNWYIHDTNEKLMHAG